MRTFRKSVVRKTKRLFDHPGTSKKRTDDFIDMSQIQQLIEMGISEDVAKIALRRNDFNVEKALEYIFSHDNIVESEDEGVAPELPPRRDFNADTLGDIEPKDYTREIVPYHQIPHVEETAEEDLIEDNREAYVHEPELSYSRFDLSELTAKQTVRSLDPPILLPSHAAIDIAPLLTILHAIPQARDALLADAKDTYEFDPSWRTGTSSKKTSLVEETQKLLAFLDGSTGRGFNTISNLVRCIPSSIASQLSGSSRSSDDSTAVGAFLEQLILRHECAADTFKMVATDGEESEPMYNILLVTREPSDTCETISDGLDVLLWSGLRDGSASPDEVTYLKEIPPVISITCRRDDAQSGSGLAVMPKFYPHRYSEANLEQVKAVHTRATNAKKESQGLFQKRFEMSNFQGVSVTKLLEVAVGHFDDETREGVVELRRLQEQYLDAREEIGVRIDKLEEEMDDVTVPPFGPDYNLMGAIISPTEFYYNHHGQWLHVAYLDEAPVSVDSLYTVRPTTVEEVCEHAARGSDQFDAQEVTLLYATSDNSDMPHEELPASLKAFLQEDRELFEALLREEEVAEAAEAAATEDLIELDAEGSDEQDEAGPQDVAVEVVPVQEPLQATEAKGADGSEALEQPQR
ncbi:hypothetical protein CJU90_6823 [Yarrowia sp. C11]|nr:hypothetical protein CJU90_6823 [Yarrowia sp. C11]KAG5364513.1 hypothetical protein CKK34_3321 [Yarrowia sp. E02]